MKYNACGRRGLKLPAFSLGLWHNFGGADDFDNARTMVLGAFDLGINHFDLANNYGPPKGSAEEVFGRILKQDLGSCRDELIISTKAGYDMWPGPCGINGSRKHLLASLDQSLRRMGIPYVDIFYSHRFDSETPLEETMGAIASAVKQGKALYAGVSSYSAKKTLEASRILKSMGVPLLIHQPSYSMLNRWIEEELLGILEQEGIGGITFSPLAQGLLSGKYLKGIPDGSRAAKEESTLRSHMLSEQNLANIRALNGIAEKRGQSLSQMALAWNLRHEQVASVLLGASSLRQIKENLAALENLEFGEEELAEIDRYAVEGGINLWAKSSDAG